MTVSFETFSLILDDAADAVRKKEEELEKAQREVERISQERDELRRERDTLAAVARRRFPGTTIQGQQGVSAFEDWADLPRTSAVLEAVRRLTEESPWASPGAIERFLREQGRDDTRDYVGAALAYLNRNEKVENKGRGRWALRHSGEEECRW